MINSQVQRSYRIGDYLFDAASRELTLGAVKNMLEERSARVLEFLCEHCGQVVSREEIVREIWDGRAVSKNSVAVVISDLRKAFGDNARTPRFIQTIPKRGYRISDVTRIAELLEHPATENMPAGDDQARTHNAMMMSAACIICSLALIWLMSGG